MVQNVRASLLSVSVVHRVSLVSRASLLRARNWYADFVPRVRRVVAHHHFEVRRLLTTDY